MRMHKVQVGYERDRQDSWSLGWKGKNSEQGELRSKSNISLKDKGYTGEVFKYCTIHYVESDKSTHKPGNARQI